jgi:hypothetical protein
MVHALLFDKLLQHAGSEAAAAVAGTLAGTGRNTGALATVISNTMVNTQGLVSSNHTSQNVEAFPTAAAIGNTNSNSNTSNSRASSSAAPAASGQIGWGLAGLGVSMGSMLLLVWSVAGKLVRVVFAVVVFAKDLALQLLMLRAVAATAKGLVAAGSVSQLQAAPACVATIPAAAAASGAPTANLLQAGVSRVLPARSTAAAGKQQGLEAPVQQQQQQRREAYAVLDQLSPPAAATAMLNRAGGSILQQQQEGAVLGSLGLLSAVPLSSTAGRRRASSPAAAASQPPQQLVQPSLRAVHWAKLHSALQRKRQRQRPAAVKVADQLLYQLWAPEAARC